jgi:hypothetical protein
MLKENLSIEDLILCLAGIAPVDPNRELPKLLSSDYSLIHSLGRQVFRNIGFTDKQYELAKRKIDDYSSYFSFLDNLEDIKNNLTLPLREIDRSRWIKIENSEKGYRIAVRFTFQKKLISNIEDIRRRISDRSDYNKENKIHYFEYTEKNLYELVEAFKDKNFDLDELSKTIYEKIKKFQREDHVPGVYNFTIKNLNSRGVEYIVKELGEPNASNLLLYKDRNFKYGLGHVDEPVGVDTGSLAYKIANRKSPFLALNYQKYKIDNLLLSLEELERYPILVLLPNDSCHDSLIQLHQYSRNIIAKKDISVVFRLDNVGEGIHFNKYIKDQEINNKVDTNTKLVYSLDNKISKPLIASDWAPRVIIVYGTNQIPSTKKVLEFYNDKDLIIFYNDGISSSHKYFYRKDIDIIQ